MEPGLYRLVLGGKTNVPLLWSRGEGEDEEEKSMEVAVRRGIVGEPVSVLRDLKQKGGTGGGGGHG